MTAGCGRVQPPSSPAVSAKQISAPRRRATASPLGEIRRGRRRERRRGGDAALRGLHLARPLEHHSLVDAQGRSLHVPLHASGVVKLDELRGADVPLDGAIDDDGAGVDLRVHPSALTDDQRVLGEDLAGELSVDPDLPLERELSLELAPLAEQRVDVTTANHHVFLLALQHRHRVLRSVSWRAARADARATSGGAGSSSAAAYRRSSARIRSRSSYEKKSISSVPFPPRSSSRTFVPRRRCRSSTTARAAALPAGFRAGADVEAREVRTMRSVSLTESCSRTMRSAAFTSSAPETMPSKARAWPMPSAPEASSSFTASGSCSSRSAFAMLARSRPTRSPTCSCVRPNSWTSRR